MADTLIAADQGARTLFSPEGTDFADVEGAGARVLSQYAFRRMRYVEPTSPQSRDGDVSAGAAQAVIRDIHFPRMSNPETPARARFNSVMEQRPRFGRDELTNEVVDYEIVYAGKDLVSVRFARCYDTIGAAHPWGNSSGITVLMGSGKLLAAGDVFDLTTEWQDFIATRAADEIVRQFPEYQFTAPAADIRETAINAAQWLITESALILLFPALSFGAPYVAGSAEVAIPWAELAPYLNANAPAPIVSAPAPEAAGA